MNRSALRRCRLGRTPDRAPAHSCVHAIITLSHFYFGVATIIENMLELDTVKAA
ncbi:hypothetical protein [Rhodococcus sp. MS13]|uniref:hypothetical protein n=1 Tax=Rhodococcus sp. MS13 TaxID=2579940 RepID=UPI001561EFE9|nr:hypothetical protein [Rhodococcus sp. MS13]